MLGVYLLSRVAPSVSKVWVFGTCTGKLREKATIELQLRSG